MKKFKAIYTDYFGGLKGTEIIEAEDFVEADVKASKSAKQSGYYLERVIDLSQG